MTKSFAIVSSFFALGLIVAPVAHAEDAMKSDAMHNDAMHSKKMSKELNAQGRNDA